MPIKNKEKLEALAAKLAKVPISTPEYKNWIQRLDVAAQNGNQEAKYTLYKTMEYATANRKDYSGLQEFVMAATAGVPGVSSFVGSKTGEKYGTVGSIVGGVLGGLVGASHDVMNIGRNIKKSKPKKSYKNFTEYDAGEVRYSDEPVKADDKISYLAERLKSGATKRTNIEEDFNTLPYFYEENPYLKLNKFNDTEKVWDFIQKYTPAKITYSEYPSPAKANPVMNLVIMRDKIRNIDVNIEPYYPRYNSDGVDIGNPFAKYDYDEITREDFRNIIDHELYHIVEKNRWTDHRLPEINIKDFMKFDDDFTNMLSNDNGDELAARIVQIKNHHKVFDGQKQFSGEEYKKMFEKYIQDRAMDNNISDLYYAVKDWDKFAKWANRIVPATLIFKNNKDAD